MNMNAYQPQPGQTAAQYLTDMAQITAVTLLNPSAEVRLTTVEDILTVTVDWTALCETRLRFLNEIRMDKSVNILALKDFMAECLQDSVEVNSSYSNMEVVLA